MTFDDVSELYEAPRRDIPFHSPGWLPSPSFVFPLLLSPCATPPTLPAAIMFAAMPIPRTTSSGTSTPRRLSLPMTFPEPPRSRGASSSPRGLDQLAKSSSGDISTSPQSPWGLKHPQATGLMDSFKRNNPLSNSYDDSFLQLTQDLLER